MAEVQAEQDELTGGKTRAHQDEMTPTAQPRPVLRAQQWLEGQHELTRPRATMSNLDELDHLNETTPVAQQWLSSTLEHCEVADSQASYLDAELASPAPGMLASPTLARRDSVDLEFGNPVAPAMLPTPSTPTSGVPARRAKEAGFRV